MQMMMMIMKHLATKNATRRDDLYLECKENVVLLTGSSSVQGVHFLQQLCQLQTYGVSFMWFAQRGSLERS
jgi:hypothetical protein